MTITHYGQPGNLQFQYPIQTPLRFAAFFKIQCWSVQKCREQILWRSLRREYFLAPSNNRTGQRERMSSKIGWSYICLDFLWYESWILPLIKSRSQISTRSLPSKLLKQTVLLIGQRQRIQVWGFRPYPSIDPMLGSELPVNSQQSKLLLDWALRLNNCCHTTGGG